MMSISGIGSIAAGQYDFTNMTNKQAISAASDLANEGKITEDQFAVLAGEVYSFLPISRTEGGGSYDPLTSTADQNFVQMLQSNITELQSTAGGDPAMQKTLATETSLMQVLGQYGASGTAQTSGTLLNQEA